MIDQDDLIHILTKLLETPPLQPDPEDLPPPPLTPEQESAAMESALGEIAAIREQLLPALRDQYEIDLDDIKPGNWQAIAALKERYRKLGLTNLY